MSIRYDPSAVLVARETVAQSARSRRLRRNDVAIVQWYEFQTLRFTRNQLWANLQAERRRFNAAPSHLALLKRPVYSFVTTVPASGR